MRPATYGDVDALARCKEKCATYLAGAYRTLTNKEDLVKLLEAFNLGKQPLV